MPRVVMDSKEVAIRESFDSRPDLFLEALRRAASDNGRIITEICVDGKPLPDWTLLPEDAPPMTRDSVIAVRTEDARAVALQALNGAREYVEQLGQSCGAVARMLRKGKAVDGSMRVASMFDGLSWIASLLGSLIDIFPLGAQGSDRADEAAGRFLMDLSNLAAAATSAQQSGDWHGLADLLDNEISEFLCGAPAVLAAIAEEVSGAPAARARGGEKSEHAGSAMQASI